MGGSHRTRRCACLRRAPSKVSATKLTGVLKEAGLKADGNELAQQVVVSVHKWPTFALDCLQTAAVQQLAKATKMYQPVQGSSVGSRYFLLAGCDDVRVGVRYNGGALGIRIEGPGFNKYTKRFSEVGFAKIQKGYASLHLEVGTDAMVANKTLGAVLLGLGIPFETPLPNLQMIAGKGS